MAKQEADYYQNLRAKINNWLKTEKGRNNKWVEYIMFAPDLFHLLCKLIVDRDVLLSDKAKLVIAIVYYITPIDLVPEALIGPVGYVDDIALAAFVLNNIINNTDPEVVKRNWAGERDVLQVIQSILRVTDQMVGIGLWKKVLGKIK